MEKHYEEMRQTCLEYADLLGEARAIIFILLNSGTKGRQQKMAQEFLDRGRTTERDSDG